MLWSGRQPSPAPSNASEVSTPAHSDDEDSSTSTVNAYETDGPGMSSKAQLDGLGRISVLFNLKRPLPDLPPDYARPVKEYAVDDSPDLVVPALSIVIFIVGSRGDVQPYLAAALRLIKDHGHRVRIATHEAFESFVLDQRAALRGLTRSDGRPLERNLEFYPIGGDPKELMAYMVKNPGLMPGFESLTNGDIQAKQKMIKLMLLNFYKSTFLPCLQTGEPFAADAIISNPPAFGHVHIAEALSIPLTMTFTMPWSRTTSFAHPLVQIKQSNAQKGLTNYLSFAMAEMLQWQGLGAKINRFRTSKLGLDKLSIASGASALDRLKVPYLYTWSSALIPKPDDWKQHIDVTGFLFLDNHAYRPPRELADFLAAGSPPIYIGFGSIVVDDPAALTSILLEAVAKSGVRALVSAGWSNMGSSSDMPSNVFLLGDCPHDWLFAAGRVSAICIHGGAGTTAIGLRNGLPVIVVPFFGDQPFWGAMIARRGAGPDPIPYAKLTSDKLADAIQFALRPETLQRAGEMGEQIRQEDGAGAFAEAFHRHLPLLNMRCHVETSHVAHWWCDSLALRLSGVTAAVLLDAGRIKRKQLEPMRPSMYDTRRATMDPLSGGTAGMLSMVTSFGDSIAMLFTKPVHAVAKMTYTMPKGIYNMLQGLTEGFEQMPNLWGSKTHRNVAVTDFGSGLIAGGRSMYFGFANGLSSAVMEPLKGAQADSYKGAAIGFAKGTASLAVQPIGGMLGFVAHPMKGAIKSIQRSIRPELAEMALDAPRLWLGEEQARHLGDDARRRILQTFDDLMTRTDERKAELKAQAAEWLADIEEQQESSGQGSQQGDGSGRDGTSSSVDGCSRPRTLRPRPPPPLPPYSEK